MLRETFQKRQRCTYAVPNDLSGRKKENELAASCASGVSIYSGRSSAHAHNRVAHTHFKGAPVNVILIFSLYM